MTSNNVNTKINEDVLVAILDRLIPAVDNLPSAGQMGLVPEVIRLAGQQDRFWGMFVQAMESFTEQNSGFTTLDGNRQDQAIKAFEASSPALFKVLLTISYIVYYKDSRVHDRIGWDGKPPQPDGQEMEPWDESALENIRKRKPFWRKV